MESKHTPGPWRKGKAPGSIISDSPVFFNGIPQNAELAAKQHLQYYGGYVICESVAPKNMNIIITAPALLEACKEAVDCIEEDLIISAGNVLKDAIAKAEGKI